MLLRGWTILYLEDMTHVAEGLDCIGISNTFYTVGFYTVDFF
jgi:hypothetical protein